jgi:TRAP transporter 4TM/12TM fusion protein
MATVGGVADATEGGTTLKRELGSFESLVVRGVAVAMTLFHLYTAYFGIFTAFRQRGLHILFALTLCFLLYAAHKGARGRVPWYDWGIIALGLFAYGYMAWWAEPLSYRLALVTPLTTMQYAVAVIGIVVLVEAARRSLGWAFMGVVVTFLIYALLGQHLWGIFRHRGFTTMWALDHIFFTWEGVFGIPAAVSATYIFMFIAFAQFLKRTGAGDYFIELSQAGMGRYRGGPAKSAVVASGLMGSVSGSAVANVVATGAITIPLMKRTGYPARLAGAVEAVASTGGQITPPVMGAAVFVMAEFTGIPYLHIIAAATIPALLYYLSVGFQVHFEAVRLGLKGQPRSELPNFYSTLFKGFHYFLPIVVIFYLLLQGFTPLYAALWALISVIVVTSFRSISRLGPRGYIDGMEDTARAAVEVAVATAAAGIVVGVVTLTGFGGRFSSLIISLAAGHMVPALILTMVVAIILGMGLPPVAAYIIQAALLVPALVQLGVPLLAAHLFAFYFAIISNITPPVALAAFAAAALAGAGTFRTAFTAMRLGIAAYIVPYMLVFGPPLLLVGAWWQIAIAALTAGAGIYALAAAAAGYVAIRATIRERVMFGTAALMLIQHQIITDVIGFALLAAAATLHQLRARRLAEVAAEDPAGE